MYIGAITFNQHYLNYKNRTSRYIGNRFYPMTQIKIFTETTYQGTESPKAPTIDTLTQKVNEFLKENEGKITVTDIKYTVQSPNPHQILNLSVKNWVVMIIYEIQ